MLNSARAYHANRWEVFAAKFFPYHTPFLTKRQRVRIRSYFRNRWRKRLNKMLVSLIEGTYADNHLKDLNLKWSIEDYEWEVATDFNKYKGENNEWKRKDTSSSSATLTAH